MANAIHLKMGCNPFLGHFMSQKWGLFSCEREAFPWKRFKNLVAAHKWASHFIHTSQIKSTFLEIKSTFLISYHTLSQNQLIKPSIICITFVQHFLDHTWIHSIPLSCSPFQGNQSSFIILLSNSYHTINNSYHTINNSYHTINNSYHTIFNSPTH